MKKMFDLDAIPKKMLLIQLFDLYHIPKVLDASRGDLLARLEKPDGLQGSGCRLQFGHKHFLTRFFYRLIFFFVICRFFLSICCSLFIVRAVFGTTEEDNNSGGLREWHNGAGEMYKYNALQRGRW